MPEKESKVKHVLSRRSLLRGGAIAGALGVGVAMTGGTGASALSVGAHQFTSHAGRPDDDASHAIVLYLPDPRSGEVDIFAGTSKSHHTSRSLARWVASLAPRD